MERLGELQHEISVQNVIQSELGQVKKTTKVYHKQPNSDIFFRSSVEKEMEKSKGTVDELIAEYKEIERQTQQNQVSQPTDPRTDI